MSKSIALASFVFVAVIPFSSAVWAELQVQADKENVVASKLDGQWETDTELTKRLGGLATGELSFKSDASVAAKVPAKFEKFFQGKQIYMAGVMILNEKEYPYVLIEQKGNPYIVFFRERDGDPLGDAESFIVMLAVGKDKQGDLLLIGGDFNNQPFSAYQRVTTDRK